MTEYNCIVILGPTACGKTNLACRISDRFNGEIISADSRQVYKKLNIGTGKDLAEYRMGEKQIKHHLIDIIEPDHHYYLHQFILDCSKAFKAISAVGKVPVIVGGTGLYLDSLRKDYSYTQIPENEKLREELQKLDKKELIKRLNAYPKDHTAHVDLNSIKRLIRAIEINEYLIVNPNSISALDLVYRPLCIGIKVNNEERKSRIIKRLDQRFKEGLIEEVKMLHENGLSYSRLEFLGLEYKWIAMYLQNQLDLNEMKERLTTSIIQYSKRQLTWFRKMEKEGVRINWFESGQLAKVENFISGKFNA